MKRYPCMARMLLMTLLSTWLSGCGIVEKYNESPYKHIFKEEEAHLTEDASSPFCDFSIDYTYLDEEGDSIATLVNRTVQGEFLGDAYASLTPEEAVDSFMSVYIRDYRRETGELYQADKAKVASEEEIPDWYNQTYSMVTFIEEGHGGTINVSANMFVDTGGAHPNQWSQWLNFDFESGKLLTKDDVFLTSAKTDIERMLLDHLIVMQAAFYPDETLKTLEDLQQKGFLQLTNMYIPDNFLLRKEGVSFLFNRYDIAPYSAGEIVIEIPYEEIGYCLKQ